MPTITFINADGSKAYVDAPVGMNLMRVAQQNGLDVEGACGGSLSCATCHMILEDSWYTRVPEPKMAEEDMLDLAFGLTPTSRLGCQVVVTDEMDGMVIKLPESE